MSTKFGEVHLSNNWNQNVAIKIENEWIVFSPDDAETFYKVLKSRISY